MMGFWAIAWAGDGADPHAVAGQMMASGAGGL